MGTHAQRARRAAFRTFRPVLERLEERALLSAGPTYTYSWSIYEDRLGDGRTPDDTLLEGAYVRVQVGGDQTPDGSPLYRIASNAETIVLGTECHVNPIAVDGLSPGDPNYPPTTVTCALPNTTRETSVVVATAAHATIRIVTSPGAESYEIITPDGNWIHTQQVQFTGTVNPFSSSDRIPVIKPCTDGERGNPAIAQSACYESGRGAFNISLFQRPLIRGAVYYDSDADGVLDASERDPIAGIRVFQDLDGDGRFDTDEPSAVTAADGSYEFYAMPAPEGAPILLDTRFEFDRYAQTTPAKLYVPHSGRYLETDIGAVRQVGATGIVFEDIDGNGVMDEGELPHADVRVFFDRNKNGKPFPSKCPGTTCVPAAFSDSNGIYVLRGVLTDEGISLDWGGFPGDAIRVDPPVGPDFVTITQSEIYVAGPDGEDIFGADLGIFYNVLLGGQVTYSDHRPAVGAHLYLDLHDNGTLNAEAVTDSFGLYSFPHVGPGTHSVWLAVADDSTITSPSKGSHAITPTSRNDVLELDFVLTTRAELERREVAGKEEVEEPERDSPELQALKVEKRNEIFARILEQQEGNPENWERLYSLAARIVRQNPEDGYIHASLETLLRLAEYIDQQTRIHSDLSFWEEEVRTIFAEDRDRLIQLGGQAKDWAIRVAEQALDGVPYVGRQMIDGLGRLYDDVEALLTDQAARDKLLLGFDAFAQRALRDASDEADFLWNDMWENNGAIFRDWLGGMGGTVVGAGVATSEYLSDWENYENFVEGLIGLESWQKAFDSDVPVEQRMGHFLIGYLSTADLAITGGRLTQVAANRAKVVLHRMSLDLFDNPTVANTVSAHLTKRLDEIALKGRAATLGGLKDGDLVPFSMLEDLGWTRKQIDALRAVAATPDPISGTPGYFLEFRTTNPKSARHIKAGAHPKPVDVTAKTINDKDVWLGYPAEHEGKVALKHHDTLTKPADTTPCKTDPHSKLCKAIKDRFHKHVDDYDKLLKGLDQSKYGIRNDGRIYDKATGKDIAGDIDPVSFRRADGSHVTGAEYDRLDQRLRDSDAWTQHAAETNVIDDKVARKLADECAKIPPGKDCIPAGTAEWHEKMDEVRKLQRKLEQGHLSGAENTIRIDFDGSVRKAEVDRLPIIDFAGNVDGLPQVIDPEQLKRLTAGMWGSDNVKTLLASSFGRQLLAKGIGWFLDELVDRGETTLDQAHDMLRIAEAEVGLDADQFAEMSAEEFVQAAYGEPSGLHIDPPPADGGEGEGAPPLTAAAILDKLREAVEEEGLAMFRVTEKENGGFLVLSRQAQEIAFDVNGDGLTSPVDALININTLNARGPHALPLWPARVELRSDINRDGFLSPIDVLLVINYLNRPAADSLGLSAASGEGESGGVFFMDGRLLWPVVNHSFPDPQASLLAAGPSVWPREARPAPTVDWNAAPQPSHSSSERRHVPWEAAVEALFNLASDDLEASVGTMEPLLEIDELLGSHVLSHAESRHSTVPIPATCRNVNN